MPEGDSMREAAEVPKARLNGGSIRCNSFFEKRDTREELGMKGTLFLLAIAIFSFAIPKTVFSMGGIAVDDEMGEREPGYGFSTGAPSRAVAEQEALSECGRAGNDDCKIVLCFERCGAYASSAIHWGVGSGKSKSEAEDKALETCGPGCSIKVSECE